jgi:DNA-binding transcriptional LysR family regulator
MHSDTSKFASYFTPFLSAPDRLYYHRTSSDLGLDFIRLLFYHKYINTENIYNVYVIYVFYIGRIFDMDLKQLSYFVKIVEEGSISGAAKKLFMSQPPLSSQMKLLETELDCTLFERGSRTIRLTEAGETLYNYSRSLLQLSNVAKQETMNAARHFNGVLRIGIVSSLIGSDALGWLCGFSKQYPGIHYEINEADTYHLLSQFETNAIHLALLRTPFHTDSLTCKKLFTDSLVAVGQESFFADNRSSGSDISTHTADTSDSAAITLDNLARLPLIVYRRWEHLLRKEFEDKNLSANWFCINDDARTTLYFVEMGMGVGIIPQSAATLVQKKGIVCRPVKNCDIATDVVLAYNSTYLPECSRAFIEYLDILYPDIP